MITYFRYKTNNILRVFVTIILLLFLSISTLYSLTYDEFVAGMLSVFSDFTDKNEGMTSFRSLYIPLGGKAEAMGSAFTGLADDIGFLEYNPAASSILENTEIAAFHNSWIETSSIDSLAFTQRKNHFGYGGLLKCFYVPFTETNIFGDSVSKGYYSETIASVNLSYNLLAGYRFHGIAIGTSFKSAFRGIPDYSDNETDNIIIGSGLAQSSVAFMADIGTMMMFNIAKFFISRDPNLRIGLSIQNLGAGITGLGTNNIQLDDPLPTRISFGVSYRVSKPVIFSLEYQRPINLQDISKSEQFAIGIGTCVDITDFFTMQGGFLLRGGSPRFSLGAEYETKRLIFNLNYTFDLTSSLTPLNRISLSVKVNLGDRGRKTIEKEIDSLYQEGLKRYSEGDLETAVALWKKILLLDKRFDPAIEGIATAEETLRLQQRIMDIQKLD